MRLLDFTLVAPEPSEAHRRPYFLVTGSACSDWHARRIVSEQAEVIGTSPWAEMLKIGALQRVRAFSGLDLHGIGTVLARPFVTQQRVLWRGGLCKASSEHHPIFDRHDRALAKKRGSRMGRITERGNAS